MIWIIGGTSETAQLVKMLKGNTDYIVSVATETGREMLDDSNVVTGRMDKNAMAEFIETNHIKKIVDLSHPYAVEVSENARNISNEKNIDYIRYTRELSDIDTSSCFSSLEECLEFLKTIEGDVFFTTGSKNICDFQKVRNKNRFIYRVLPTEESIKLCRESNVDLKDIIAALGPFSLEMNIATFKEYKANYVVMKDSGIAGGTAEKVKACQKLKIQPVIIGRKPETGYTSIKSLAECLINKN